MNVTYLSVPQLISSKKPMEMPWERLTCATYYSTQCTQDSSIFRNGKLFSSLAMSKFKVRYQSVTGCHVNIHIGYKFRSPSMSMSNSRWL